MSQPLRRSQQSWSPHFNSDVHYPPAFHAQSAAFHSQRMRWRERGPVYATRYTPHPSSFSDMNTAIRHMSGRHDRSLRVLRSAEENMERGATGQCLEVLHEVDFDRIRPAELPPRTAQRWFLLADQCIGLDDRYIATDILGWIIRHSRDAYIRHQACEKWLEIIQQYAGNGDKWTTHSELELMCQVAVPSLSDEQKDETIELWIHTIKAYIGENRWGNAFDVAKDFVEAVRKNSGLRLKEAHKNEEAGLWIDIACGYLDKGLFRNAKLACSMAMGRVPRERQPQIMGALLNVVEHHIGREPLDLTCQRLRWVLQIAKEKSLPLSEGDKAREQRLWETMVCKLFAIENCELIDVELIYDKACTRITAETQDRIVSSSIDIAEGYATQGRRQEAFATLDIIKKSMVLLPKHKAAIAGVYENLAA